MKPFLESVRFIDRGIRSALKRVPLLRGPVLLAEELKLTLFHGSRQSLREVENLFQGAHDPFGFAREAERIRFERAEAMLDAVRAGRQFRNALEVGCAEGWFTRMLAPRCEKLMAVDISPTALVRARECCRGMDHVEFQTWDLRRDPAPSRFDLIVAAGVVEYIRQPRVLRQVREKLVQALLPGGVLLLGNTAADEVVERSWWGRLLLRGTWINRFVAQHPELQLLDRALDQCACPFEHVLLKKRS